MSPRDLTAVAAAHSDQRRRDADTLVHADASGLLARFRAFVDGSAFSTNITADKVLVYDEADEILDTRSVRILQAGGDTAAGLATFASGAWSAQREAFEDLWDGGRGFVYGAVNAGGMGVEGSYGGFCVAVDDPDRASPVTLVVFPSDSARRYTTPPADVDEPRAADEATSWEDRASLVTLERHAEVDGDETSWPLLVCSPLRYFETVIAPGPRTSGISQVRLRTDYQAELVEFQARDLAGDATLTEVERNQAAAYDVIQSWRRSFGTTIVEVD